MNLRLLIYFVLFFSIKTVTAQTISIPDTNFEQALIDLNIDSDDTVNGEVLQTDVESIITLNVNNKNISSLSGIEGFTSLKNLLCGHNNLTTIDLSANVLLEILHVNNNDLVALDLSQNIALTTLFVSSNNLTNLDLQNNVLLTYVSAPFNQISSIDVSNNTALETLFLLENNLSSLDVSGLSSLVTLYCYNNSLTSLNLNNASSLQDLECFNNSIQDLNLETNTSLLKLHCFNNNISSLNLENNLLLEDLRCYKNNITQLDLSNNSLLTSVVCFDNNLTSLNLKNGNNTNMSNVITTNNSELTCIDVDNVDYSTANWTSIDPQTSFSENCSSLSVNENLLDHTISMYPNPASHVFYIKGLNEISQLKIIDINGRSIIESNVDNNSSINIEFIPTGIYFLHIKNSKGTTTKKLVKS